MRPGAAPRRRGHRPRPALRRLRHGRPAGPDEADPARGRPADHRRVQAERDPGRHLAGEERDARRRRSSPQNAHTHREREIARLFRRYQARLQLGRRARLRRPAARGGAALPGGARGPGAIPGPVALPPRRRVPGHEPPAVPVGQGPRGGAPEPLRRGRRRPVDLLLARRRHPQHPGLRARLPRRHRREARAELPLHAADPRRRACRRHQQLLAQGQEALDRERGRPADLPVRGLQRGRGGGVDRPPDRGADGRSGHDPDPSRRRGSRALGAARHRRHVPDERPEPRHRRGVPALQHPLPARGRDALLPAPRGQGRAGVPAGPAQRHRPGQLRAGAQRPGARASARRASRSCAGSSPRAAVGRGRGRAEGPGGRPRPASRLQAGPTGRAIERRRPRGG